MLKICGIQHNPECPLRVGQRGLPASLKIRAYRSNKYALKIHLKYLVEQSSNVPLLAFSVWHFFSDFSNTRLFSMQPHLLIIVYVSFASLDVLVV